MKEEPQEPDTEMYIGCPLGKYFLWKESDYRGNDRGRRWAAFEEWQPVPLDCGIWSNGLQVVSLETSKKGVFAASRSGLNWPQVHCFCPLVLLHFTRKWFIFKT